jgi:CoA-transferase family III
MIREEAADQSAASADGGPATQQVRGEGMQVLEIGHFIAAPFATRIVADLRAKVIKVEPPEVDHARCWGNTIDGRSIWSSVNARNKKYVTIELKHPKGREIFFALVATADAVVENFRAGQGERLGAEFEAKRERRPGLVLVRISGFVHTGPYRDKVAFDIISEANGELRYLTGYPASSRVRNSDRDTLEYLSLLGRLMGLHRWQFRSHLRSVDGDRRSSAFSERGTCLQWRAFRHRVLLDDLISGWTAKLPSREVEAILDDAAIPASRAQLQSTPARQKGLT